MAMRCADKYSLSRKGCPRFDEVRQVFYFGGKDEEAMNGIIWVGVGSFIGGILRYGVNTWVHRLLDIPGFPLGTLAVNMIGCLVIGFLTGLAETWTTFNTETRLFLFVGVLGGFTTFSAFALETFELARGTQHGAAFVNIGLQIVLGLLAVWLGGVFAHAASH